MSELWEALDEIEGLCRALDEAEPEAVEEIVLRLRAAEARWARIARGAGREIPYRPWAGGEVRYGGRR
jgi:hypothetical protein